MSSPAFLSRGLLSQSFCFFSLSFCLAWVWCFNDAPLSSSGSVSGSSVVFPVIGVLFWLRWRLGVVVVDSDLVFSGDTIHLFLER
jgi:hypothetical protein